MSSIQHVEPLRVPGGVISGVERVGAVFVQPVVTVEEKELLAPQHARDRLAHHVGRVFAHRRRRDRLVELIGLTTPVLEEFVEMLAKGCALLVQETAGEPQANDLGLPGADRDLVVRRDLGALLAGIHRVLSAVHHTVIDPVFDVGALVRGAEQPRMVGFVLGEEQRHLAFARKDECPQRGMRRRDRGRACRCLDLLEVWFLGRAIRLGNPLRPVVAEPQRRQEMQRRPHPVPDWPP